MSRAAGLTPGRLLDVRLRPETPADEDEIETVVASAFDGRPNEPALVRRLRPADVALVAVRDGQVVGHVMLSPVEVVDGDRVARALVLAPLSVHPSAQGQGVGAALVHRALELAGSAVVVLGDPGYYGRFGFEPCTRHGVRPPEGVPAEPFSVWLPPGGAEVQGTVRFPAAFAETGTV
jgi:putative acetyltransferase